ncbi:hypothetical protein CR513_48411, partial [Mucuna pruriens]
MLFGCTKLYTKLRWECLLTGLSSKVKNSHDQQILRKEFRVGQKVLLFNLRLKLIGGKLRSRWDGPFVITNVFPYSVVELKDEHTNSTFQVNRHQIKLFHEGPASIAGEMKTISLIEPTPKLWAFVHVPKDERSKFDMKTRQCIFIGYGQDEYNPIEKKLVKSCDVKFMEYQTIEDIDKVKKTTHEKDNSLFEIGPVWMLVHDLDIVDNNVQIGEQHNYLGDDFDIPLDDDVEEEQ